MSFTKRERRSREEGNSGGERGEGGGRGSRGEGKKGEEERAGGSVFEKNIRLSNLSLLLSNMYIV